MRIKTHNQSRYTERPDTTGLCILLLHSCDIASNVVNCDRILESQPMTLCFDSGLVDQYSGVGIESGKRQGYVVVYLTDLLCRPIVLKLQQRLLLHRQNATVFRTYPHGCRTPFHGLVAVLDLKQSSIRTEDGKRPIVRHAATRAILYYRSTCFTTSNLTSSLLVSWFSSEER